MRNYLNENEKEMLSYIESYVSEHGYPPTVRDMCRDLHIKSTATAFVRIRKLMELGFVKQDANRKRALELSNRPQVVNVPVVGTITAGQPILAVQNIDEYYPLPVGEFGASNLFMLKVKGDSMINAGILDGDTIVVKQQQTADNGQIVAAMIEDSATVKQFYKENGHFRLQPANDMMEPIICNTVDILGLVVGLYRKL